MSATLTERELVEAQRRLQRQALRAIREPRHATLRSRTQASLDRLDEQARAVGKLDVLVLLPSGRVGRLRTRGRGLLAAQWRDTPRDCGWRAGTAERDGDWIRFQAPDGWTATGLIVDRP